MDDDIPGHVLLFHYGQDGSVATPIDVTPSPSLNRVPIFSNLAYGEKTSLLYGSSFLFAHTQPGPYAAFATVSGDGVPSSFNPLQGGDFGPPVSPNGCFTPSSEITLGYTHDGIFGLFYNATDSAVTVSSVTGGVANFVSRTGQFGTDCAAPLLRGAALDEPHNAFYAVLHTLDPIFETPVSAVLAQFNFNPMTGKISPQPAQQIRIETDDHIYIPRFGSRLFVFNATRVIAYTLTGNGPQNPESVPLAFPPQMLFGDTPRL